jgi:transglutaminase-like putative cysteine protease
MAILHIRHKTTYRYKRAVEFGEHRLMCRPRDSHDLRLLLTTLTIEPAARSLRWIHDVFGNSIAIATFDRAAAELTFHSGFRAEHFPAVPRAIAVEPFASRIPFSYSIEDAMDLGRTKERHYEDPGQRVDDWAAEVVERIPQARTLDVLIEMASSIQKQFKYEARDEVGVQSPVETLELGTGSCRDFALFMMEAVRSLGLAARFVSGYLYDEELLGAGGGLVGGGATHAWLQVFLPGAGWIEFDPTNALVGGRNLIRVAVTRDPSQAVPLAGSFKGEPEDFDSMSVDVEVTTE